MKKRQILIACLLSLLFLGSVEAGKYKTSGEISQTLNSSAVGKVTFTLKWTLDNFMGEMTRRAVFKYTSEKGEGVSGLEWRAQVVSKSGGAMIYKGKYVYMGRDWEEGTFKKSGGGFGSDVSGSPSWDKCMHTFDRKTQRDGEWLPKDEVIKLMKAGIKLDYLLVLKVNGTPIKYR